MAVQNLTSLAARITANLTANITKTATATATATAAALPQKILNLPIPGVQSQAVQQAAQEAVPEAAKAAAKEAGIILPGIGNIGGTFTLFLILMPLIMLVFFIGMWLWGNRLRIKCFLWPDRYEEHAFRTYTGFLKVSIEPTPEVPWVIWNGGVYFRVRKKRLMVQGQGQGNEERESIEEIELNNPQPSYKAGRLAGYQWNEGNPWPVDFDTGDVIQDPITMYKFEVAALLKGLFSEGGLGEWLQKNALWLVLLLVAGGVAVFFIATKNPGAAAVVKNNATVIAQQAVTTAPKVVILQNGG